MRTVEQKKTGDEKGVGLQAFGPGIEEKYLGLREKFENYQHESIMEEHIDIICKFVIDFSFYT